MTVEVDEAHVHQLMKAAAKRIATKVQIPGFRPGKAPYAMIERRFGEEAIRHEALEDLGDKVFRQALEEANVEPYAAPSMEDISWRPLTMTVRIPVAPVVELGDYHTLRLPIPEVDISEAEVDEALTELQDDRATWKAVDRPAQIGDKVAVTARVSARGKTVVDDDDAELILAERDPDATGPDLLTPLVGASAGDDREFVVTYPEDYSQADLAGADATVKFHIRSVLEKETYPLDDDFAQMIGDFSTLGELRDKLRADLLQQKQYRADRELADQAFQKIVAGANRIEWPAVAEQEALDRWISGIERNMKQHGLPLDDYLRTQQKTRDQYREEIRPRVQEQLRLSFVAQEIATREGLAVDTGEIMNYIEMMGNIAGDRRDEVLQSLISRSGVRRVAQDLLDAKMRERLLRIVKGELTDEQAGSDALPGAHEDQPAADPTAENQPVAADSTEEAAPKARARTRQKPKAASATDE
jgi:trigger factor